MHKRLRFRDLKELGVVRNRPTLRNWIKDRGFPPGQLTGPNSRTWGEAEVQAWLDRRPTALRELTPLARRGRCKARADSLTSSTPENPRSRGRRGCFCIGLTGAGTPRKEVKCYRTR